MEHYFGMIEIEDHAEAIRIAHIAYERNKIKFRISFLQFKTDFVKRRLGIIEDDEAGHTQLGHLATELAADASGTSGYHHYRSRKGTMHFLAVDGDFIATQKVLDFYFTNTIAGRGM